MNPDLGCRSVFGRDVGCCALHRNAAGAAAVRDDRPRGGDTDVTTGKGAIHRDVSSAGRRSCLREVEIHSREHEVEPHSHGRAR